MMSAESFRQITIEGNAQQRGFSYGQQLGRQILQVIEVYRELWQRDDAEILSRADRYRRLLRENADTRLKEYSVEIDNIAEAIRDSFRHDFNPLWLYALNARTELLSLSADECTAIYFRPTALLGQNWDWAECFEKLAILLTIVPDEGPTIWTLTEPGIIGKVGMNSAGVGVCLNILRCSGMTVACDSVAGLPVHITLRMILESPSLEAARQVLQSHRIDTVSNILVGDATGNCFDVEFAGSEQNWLPCAENTTFHTNHYCCESARCHNEPFESKLQSSYARFDRTSELLANNSDFSLARMKSVLLDQTGLLPIHRRYEEYPGFPRQHKVGTVATILMDLKQRSLKLQRGSG